MRTVHDDCGADAHSAAIGRTHASVSALTFLLPPHSAAAICVVFLLRAAWEPKYEDEKKFYYASKVVQDKHNLDGSAINNQHNAPRPRPSAWMAELWNRWQLHRGRARNGASSPSAVCTPTSDRCLNTLRVTWPTPRTHQCSPSLFALSSAVRLILPQTPFAAIWTAMAASICCPSMRFVLAPSCTRSK